MQNFGKETYISKIPYPKVEGFNLSFQKVIADVLIDKIRKVLKEKNRTKLVVAGGVSANTYIRKRLDELKKENIEVYYPPLRLCTDNAGMIAAQRIL